MGWCVAGGQIMEAFVDKEEDFEVDALEDLKPMEFVKDKGIVVTGAGEGE